jgi:hypothetical protein
MVRLTTLPKLLHHPQEALALNPGRKTVIFIKELEIQARSTSTIVRCNLGFRNTPGAFQENSALIERSSRLSIFGRSFARAVQTEVAGRLAHVLGMQSIEINTCLNENTNTVLGKASAKKKTAMALAQQHPMESR